MCINFKTISGLEISLIFLILQETFEEWFRFQSHLGHKGQHNNLIVNVQSGAIQDAEIIDEPVNVCFVCSSWIIFNQIWDLNMQITGK